MMSINYTLHFERGMSIALRGQACFVFLKNFKDNLEYQYNIEYSNEYSPKIKTLEFFLIGEELLKRERLTVKEKHFFSYLYKKYSPYLIGSLEDIYNRNSIIIDGNCPSKLAYVILSFFRFYIECPYKITHFYKLKDVKNRDLAFLTSMCLNVFRNFMTSDHSPILDMSMYRIKSFITGEWEEKHILKIDPDYLGASCLFSNHEDNDGLLNEGMDGLSLFEKYERLEEKYEKYISTMEQQLRKTFQTEGSGNPNSKKVRRFEEWRYVLFGEGGVP